jgi:hypothetical protein
MSRWMGWGAILGLVMGALSCTTTYDAYGRPVQSVDPGVAVAGAAAAGVIGYSIARDRDRNWDRRYYHRETHHRHGVYDRYGRRVYR